jgi:hypothetical protein
MGGGRVGLGLVAVADGETLGCGGWWVAKKS